MYILFIHYSITQFPLSVNSSFEKNFNLLNIQQKRQKHGFYLNIFWQRRKNLFFDALHTSRSLKYPRTKPLHPHIMLTKAQKNRYTSRLQTLHNGRRTQIMGCLCQLFEDYKCLWIIIFALLLLSSNGCLCGNDGCGSGCGTPYRPGCNNCCN